MSEEEETVELLPPPAGPLRRNMRYRCKRCRIMVADVTSMDVWCRSCGFFLCSYCFTTNGTRWGRCLTPHCADNMVTGPAWKMARRGRVVESLCQCSAPFPWKCRCGGVCACHWKETA